MNWWNTLLPDVQQFVLLTALVAFVLGVVFRWVLARQAYAKLQQRFFILESERDQMHLDQQRCTEDKSLLYADVQRLTRQLKDLKSVYSGVRDEKEDLKKQYLGKQQEAQQLQIKLETCYRKVEDLKDQIIGIKTQNGDNGRVSKPEVQTYGELERAVHRLERIVEKLDHTTNIN